jgi:hypothetical protein
MAGISTTGPSPKPQSGAITWWRGTMNTSSKNQPEVTTPPEEIEDPSVDIDWPLAPEGWPDEPFYSGTEADYYFIEEFVHEYRLLLTGYSSGSVTEKWRNETASHARMAGAVRLYDLVYLLAQGEEYNETLPRLWEDYCGFKGSRVGTGRRIMPKWNLWRFVYYEKESCYFGYFAQLKPLNMYDDINHVGKYPKEKDIKFNDYIALNEFSSYAKELKKNFFQEQINIPLPRSLFPEQEELDLAVTKQIAEASTKQNIDQDEQEAGDEVDFVSILDREEDRQNLIQAGNELLSIFRELNRKKEWNSDEAIRILHEEEECGKIIYVTERILNTGELYYNLDTSKDPKSSFMERGLKYISEKRDIWLSNTNKVHSGRKLYNEYKTLKSKQ